MSTLHLQDIKNMKPWQVALIGLLVLATPAARHTLEQLPITHMIIQLPLLALVGMSFVDAIPARWLKQLEHTGLTGGAGLLVAIFTALFWMIPRSLDAAIDSTGYEITKFISVPFLLGVPLRLSWYGVSEVVRGFVGAQFIAMLAFLGWLYAASPVRVCNNYLAADQEQLGWCLLLIALSLALSQGLKFLLGEPSAPAGPPAPISPSHIRRPTNVC